MRWFPWGARYTALVETLRQEHAAEVAWYRQELSRLERRIDYFQDALLAIQVGVVPQAVAEAAPKVAERVEQRLAESKEWAMAGGEVG